MTSSSLSEEDGDDLVGSSDTTTTAIVFRWNRMVGKYAYTLLVMVVLLVWPLGRIALLRFQGATDSTVHPILGSPSFQAQQAFDRVYHHGNKSSSENASTYNQTCATDWSDPLNPPLMIVLEAIDTNTSLTKQGSPPYVQAKTYTQQLQGYLEQSCWEVGSSSEQEDRNKSSINWFRVSSFYSLAEKGFPTLAQSTLASPNGSTVLVQIQYLSPSANEPTTTKLSNSQRQRMDREIIHQLMDCVQDFGDSYLGQSSDSYFVLRYTGLPWFQTDLSDAMVADLQRMDYVVLPLALLFLGLVFWKVANPWVVWIVPLISMLSTVAVWSLVMWFVATRNHVQITQFTPTVMMSLTVGMGIDYTLFMLARYLEDGEPECQEDAVARMLGQGGQVLVLSGLTLMCTFLGLCFLPLPMLQSVGIGAAVTIACSLLVNLTVVPALLYTPLGRWIRKIKEVPGASLSEDDPDDRNDSVRDHPQPVPPSLWYRLSKHLLHPYRGIIIFLVTIQILLSISQYAPQIKSSISFDLMLPSSSPALQTFQSLSQTFGRGHLNPYQILFDGNEANVTMTSSGGFHIMQIVLDELMGIDEVVAGMTESIREEIGADTAADLDRMLYSRNAPCPIYSLEEMDCNQEETTRRQPRTSFTGICVLDNLKIPHSLFLMAKYCVQANVGCPFEGLRTINLVDELATSDDRYATYVSVSLGVDPFSEEGVTWLESARASIRLLEDSGRLNGVRVYIQGVAAIEYDAYDAVYETSPTMIVITTTVVFVLMGVFFRSLLLPIRSIVSIGLTLTFSFGFGVLVYENGILDWIGLPALSAVGGEFCWLVPITTFSIVVGLALDYDVFLVSRILEFRLKGYEHKTSIAAALNATGGIITAAGLIMAFAFGSLLFSSSPVLCQWSFVITVAVLLDTFVVRSIVVPTITGFAGSNSWWPRELPRATTTMPEFDGGLDAVSSLLRSLEASSEYEPLPRGLPRTP